MSDTKLNLRQKLIEIYNAIDHVDKMGNNKKQGYKFVRAADVMRPIRDAFAKWGIYAETNFELLGTYDIKTNSGGNMHTASVKATIKLFDSESDETKIISGLGDGADGGDKGVFKAQTGAMKNALRNGLLLPDEGDPNGGDPEADEDVDTRTVENYSHPASTTAMPDYTDYEGVTAKESKSRPVVIPKDAQGRSEMPVHTGGQTQTFAYPPAQTPQEFHQEVKAERGDAYEEPEVSKLPTEEEMTAYRERFVELSKQLSSHGKLTASKGLKTNTKLQVFLLSITKADAAKNITTSQWDNFFERVGAAIANPEVGLLGLTKLINKANGLETKS